MVATATELARYTGRHLIAVQTVLHHGYLTEIFAGLRAAGIDVFHVLLDADEAVLRPRILASGEAVGWRLDHLEQYQAARAYLIEAADVVVRTDSGSPDQVAAEIAAAVGAKLALADLAGS